MNNIDLTQEDILELFKDTGVLLEGHFKLTSGMHSPQFLQCAQVLRFPDHAEKLATLMARPFQNEQVDKVVGPAMGGIILSYEVARQLGAEAIYAEKSDHGLRLRRGFSINPEEKVVVVEDAVTTGGTVNSVVEIFSQNRANILGVSVLVDRSGGEADFGVPYHSVVELNIPSYAPADCPLCKEEIPLVSPKELGM